VPTDRRTNLGLIAVAVIWGANFVIVKVALEELSPLALNALRFPLASALLLVILRGRGRLHLPERRDFGRVLGLGVLGNIVYQMLFIYGLDLTRAGNASLLLATVPAWTSLLSYLLGHERPSPLVWTGIVGTLFGMGLVVVGGSGFALGGATLAGDLLMIGAAAGWSMYTVGSRDLIHRYGPLRVTSWTMWVGTGGLVLAGAPALAATPFQSVSTLTWAAVAYAGFFALSIAYLLWYTGVQRIGSALTAVYSNLVPVVALLAAWIWLAERPTVLQAAGAAVILAGISIARLGTSRLIPAAGGAPETTPAAP
jgi:drug/metabolite transporter (DMT)-like permease